MLKKTLQSLVCFFSFYLLSMLCEYWGWAPAKKAFFCIYVLIVVLFVLYIAAESLIYTTERQGEEHHVSEGVILFFGSTAIILALALLPALVALIARIAFDVDFYTCFVLNMFFVFVYFASSYIFHIDSKENCGSDAERLGEYQESDEGRNTDNK